MNKKTENFLILTAFFVWLFIVSFIFLCYVFDGAEGPLIFFGFLYIVPVFYAISLYYFKDRPIIETSTSLTGFISILLIVLAVFIMLSYNVKNGWALRLAKYFDSENFCGYYHDQDECFKELAIKRGDEKLCGAIRDEIFPKESGRLAQCYWKVGLINEDVTLCRKAGNFQDMCIMDIAEKTKDISICEQLNLIPKTNFSSDYCKRLVNNN